MGSGTWSTDVYTARAAARKASGTSAFSYNDDVLSKMRYDEQRVADRLNPFGIKWRESRDSDEHPNSNAIAVAFDVTGSMGSIPRVLQTKLPKLHTLLQDGGYIEHPQLLFAAIGDPYTDRAPLQIGQFESDNRMEEDLGNIWLEGNGGGQMREGYELFLYFLARKTSIDCDEKRGKKGYAFIIGDEMAYPAANKQHLKALLGVDEEENISLTTLVEEVQKRYELFFILAQSTSYAGNREITGFWRDLLGERALILHDPADVCETIAMAIGLNEGAIAAVDLDAGSTAASKALAGYAAKRPAAKTKAHSSKRHPAVPAVGATSGVKRI